MDRATPFSCDAIGGKQRIGSLALRGDNHGCSPTGGFCKGVAGQWEPDEVRASRPVLRARGGETPLRDSPCATNALTKGGAMLCKR